MKDMYAWEKFSSAIRGMAVSSKSIQQRLADAYVYNLIHVDPEKLPGDIRADFIQLNKRLTAVAPLAGEGSVQATVSGMSDQEATEIGSRIVDMYFRVESDYNAG